MIEDVKDAGKLRHLLLMVGWVGETERRKVWVKREGQNRHCAVLARVEGRRMLVDPVVEVRRDFGQKFRSYSSRFQADQEARG
jgi:hypothetical protein